MLQRQQIKEIKRIRSNQKLHNNLTRPDSGEYFVNPNKDVQFRFMMQLEILGINSASGILVTMDVSLKT